MHDITTKPSQDSKPLFSGDFHAARIELNLSQHELAEKLNTSFYALVRWERGDTEPSQDVLERLKELLDPKSTSDRPSSFGAGSATFESSGVRSRPSYLPLFDKNDVRFLQEPKSEILDGLFENSLWGDGALALGDILQRCDQAANTLEMPLDEGISAGKNTYTYDAHTYHTKVPPQGIAKIIAKYLPESGVVLDPFAGSGMTGVAARYIGRDVILNELSPAASFIAHNFTKTVDVGEFNSAVARIMENLTGLREQLYTTECRECGADTEQIFAVWSYELICNHCDSSFVLWDHCRKYGNTIREHKLLRKFPCPHCKKEVNKSYLKRLESHPVFVGYKCCNKKIVEHEPNTKDLMNISQAEDLLTDFSDHFPTHDLPDGVNLNQPKRHGLDSIDKFYTKRNLVACAALWREIRRIEDPELSAAVAFVFTSLYQRVTRLSEYRFWGGSGNTANFNVPHISNEANVFITFERKAKSIADHFVSTAQNYGGRCAIRTGSATDLNFLPDGSIDFIFTDPPFGANINYSEMNTLWEAWLQNFTDATDEAIMNKSQGKTLDDYQSLMTDSLKESYRVLRSGHWMVLVFMNSSEKVWASLKEAIVEAGFSIEKINIFDKQHGTFKQFVSDNTAGSDLMIHCRKPSPDQPEVPQDVQSGYSGIEGVAKFLEEEKNRIPILPFLHVKRDSEIDFRTLYSRYIARAMHGDSTLVGFSRFRLEAQEIIGKNH